MIRYSQNKPEAALAIMDDNWKSFEQSDYQNPGQCALAAARMLKLLVKNGQKHLAIQHMHELIPCLEHIENVNDKNNLEEIDAMLSSLGKSLGTAEPEKIRSLIASRLAKLKASVPEADEIRKEKDKPGGDMGHMLPHKF